MLGIALIIWKVIICHVFDCDYAATFLSYRERAACIGVKLYTFGVALA